MRIAMIGFCVATINLATTYGLSLATSEDTWEKHYYLGNNGQLPMPAPNCPPSSAVHYHLAPSMGS